MTAHQIELIKTTWQKAATDPAYVGELFYACLFEIAPEVKPLFSHTTAKEQSKKLLAMLSYVIGKLESLDDIKVEVAKLAQRHIKYGVEENHYIFVGTALIWTLEKTLATDWTEEVKQAWLTCYRILSHTMITAGSCIEEDAA